MRTWTLAHAGGRVLQIGFSDRPAFAVEGTGEPAVFPSIHAAERVRDLLVARRALAVRLHVSPRDTGDERAAQWQELHRIVRTAPDAALLEMDLDEQGRALAGLSRREVSA